MAFVSHVGRASGVGIPWKASKRHCVKAEAVLGGVGAAWVLSGSRMGQGSGQAPWGELTKGHCTEPGQRQRWPRGGLRPCTDPPVFTAAEKTSA